jgi:hypothetical protein
VETDKEQEKERRRGKRTGEWIKRRRRVIRIKRRR